MQKLASGKEWWQERWQEWKKNDGNGLRGLVDHSGGHPASGRQWKTHVGREVNFAIGLHFNEKWHRRI